MSNDKSEKIKDAIKVLKDICVPKAKKSRQRTPSQSHHPIFLDQARVGRVCKRTTKLVGLFLPAARHWRRSESYDRQNKPGILSHTAESKAGSVRVAPSAKRQRASASRRQNGHIALSVLQTKMQPGYPAGSRSPSWRKRGLGNDNLIST